MLSVRHRQALLFAGAVIVPSVVLVGLGLHAIAQERELAAKRADEERRRSVTLAGQELLTRLESLKLNAAGGQITASDPEVVLTARIVSGQLVLPWENSRSGKARLDLERAAEFAAQGNRAAAGVISRALVRREASDTDEYGVPISLYAAKRLLAGASAEDRHKIAAAIEKALESPRLSPPGAYLARELADGLGGNLALRERAAVRIAELEQATQLARDVPRLASSGPEPLWVLSGQPPWLVGITGRPADPERILVAVRAEPLLASVQRPARYQWVLDAASPGESLGEHLSGFRLYAPAGAPDAPPLSRKYFLIAALALGISVTAFSAWLLHRDTRREARLGALRGQFVSSVSHELRTPISTIRACAEMLEMGRVEGRESTAEYLRTIIGESGRLSRLVDGVLDFSRIEQGKRTYRFGQVWLDEVVRSAVQALAYPITQGGFELRVEVEVAVPVHGDRGALEQAVTNLLTNAMKYSGGRREIGVSVDSAGDQAAIRVRDHGVGIAAEDQQRIFERFYRVPAQAAGGVPGAGLGLALVDHVARAHGGRVTVESRPGEGSVFSILLPIAEGA